MSDAVRVYRLAEPSSRATAEALRELGQLAAVAYAEPNLVRRPFRVPDDPLYRHQWHLQRIGLAQGWERTTGSPQTVIAVVDTGIVAGHPDLAGRILPGRDLVSDPAEAGAAARWPAAIAGPPRWRCCCSRGSAVGA